MGQRNQFAVMMDAPTTRRREESALSTGQSKLAKHAAMRDAPIESRGEESAVGMEPTPKMVAYTSDSGEGKKLFDTLM